MVTFLTNELRAGFPTKDIPHKRSLRRRTQALFELINENVQEFVHVLLLDWIDGLPRVVAVGAANTTRLVCGPLFALYEVPKDALYLV